MNANGYGQQEPLRGPDDNFRGLAPTVQNGDLEEFGTRADSINWMETDNAQVTSALVERTNNWIALHPTQPLFPNATTLRARCLSSLGVHVVAQWLSAALATLDIILRAGVDHHALADLLFAIILPRPFVGPAINSFTLIWDSHAVLDHEFVEACGALANIFRPRNPFPNCLKFLHLSLDFVAGSDEVWDAIAALPALEELRLSARTNIVQAATSWRGRWGRPNVFPMLKRLHISAPIEEATEIVRATRPNLEELRLEVPLLAAFDERIVGALRAMALACRALRRVHIFIKDMRVHEQVAGLLLQPLYPLPLVAFSLRYPSEPLSLSDEEFEEMVRAWPSLRHLELNPLGRNALGLVFDKLPTLNAVMIALARCPSLRHLGLRIDPNAPVTAALHSWGILRTLDLGVSQGTYWNAPQVARVLHDSLPVDRGYHALEIDDGADQSEWVRAVAQEFEVLRRS
ncbi:hypothetical protein PUNSTDRAFT_130834 [Punctularia strigosozonata HHB-11173 SS5]|uniref:uncharacterized protein n=1 Tax=Punctularia strigosozonata (strain HHB-11173) TaxID=741275 RepID=UPI000441867F|nr:uncharacterized protein PUNSTDRAFT_130834 [Punctularia strigosozonata HHB-11173 SS5]EIN12577.1 hypothetical protein PUNSTDRAFT_130834 [Punctularia strigosozonata HHB-11173 SS5]